MRRTRLVFAVVALACLASPPAALADKEKAKELFKQGNAAYKLDHFDEAIADFEAAYREEPSPVFLFNIAQAHRLAKRPRQAAEFYRKYLKDTPDAKNRAKVEEQIAACEVDAKRLDEEAAARKAAELAAQRERERLEQIEREEKLKQALAQPPPPPESKKRWPMWIGIGVGAAVVVAGAVTAGVLLSQPSEPSLGLESAR